MSNNVEWIDDIHRWYYGGTAPASYREDDEDNDVLSTPDAMGYEAAQPSLQATDWPDAPRKQAKPAT